jgi:hypothetical protein
MTMEGFRLSNRLGVPVALARIKKWCKINGVPYGRLMNQVILALSVIDEYEYGELGVQPHLVVSISIPPQVNPDYHAKYVKRLVNMGLSDKNDNVNSNS